MVIQRFYDHGRLSKNFHTVVYFSVTFFYEISSYKYPVLQPLDNILLLMRYCAMRFHPLTMYRHFVTIHQHREP